MNERDAVSLVLGSARLSGHLTKARSQPIPALTKCHHASDSERAPRDKWLYLGVLRLHMHMII
jgi:hypothetical protein